MRAAFILLSSAPGQRRAVHLLLIEDDVRIASLLERDEGVTERIPRPARPKGRTGRHEIVVWYRVLEQSVLARSQDVRFVVLLSAQLATVLAYSIVSAARTTKSAHAIGEPR